MWIEKNYGENDASLLFADLLGLISRPESIAFRGQAKASWKLEPSIERSAPAALYAYRLEEEISIVSAFRRNAKRFMGKLEEQYLLPKVPISFSILAVLQHFGAPTRILDWTYSPFVALYFAAIEEPDEDGAIFWFDRDLFNAHGPDWERMGCKKRTGLGQIDIDAYAFQARISQMAVDSTYDELSFDRGNAGVFRLRGHEVWRIQWVKAARMLFGWLLTAV